MVQQNPKKSKRKMTPDELYKQSKESFNPNLPPPKPMKSNPELTYNQKFEILAKGQVFGIWIMTILLSAVLMLIAILYPVPINYAIIGMAIGMDLLAVWMTRKYMRK